MKYNKNNSLKLFFSILLIIYKTLMSDVGEQDIEFVGRH